MTIRRLQPGALSEWARMRGALWPDYPPASIMSEIEEILADPRGNAVFVVPRGAQFLCGFVEVSLRSWVDETAASPVAYIEGWYVDDDQRRSGVGAMLLQ